MLKKIQLSIISILFITFSFADVFMTELTDPQNSSDAGRYVELYNNGDSDIDFSTGWLIQRWTNGNADPSTPQALTGIISAGGFYIVCNDEDKFSETYGLTCDQDIGTGGPADSNGDDNMALVGADGLIVDMFGVPGEDGTGTGHEFEDGRAERSADNTSASATWDEAGWNIDNDSGGGDGNQYAPEGFDPGAWIGASSGGDDGGATTCDDESACNTGADGDCEYPETGYDCDGNCVGDLDCAGNCGGGAVNDCAGECGGTAIVDNCGECGGDNSSCSVNVTFSVDMSIEGVTGDIKLRTSTENGEYLPSDWYTMTDDGDGTYFHTLSLLSGVTYGYNFNNSVGSGYESGAGLADCGGGNYGNDRFVTPGDTDIVMDAVCWESCEACPEDILGCMDETALNYDTTATSDDGSCIFDWPEVANLFFSEVAEGSSNNKYLEIYNATDGDVDLSGYSLSSCSNGCDDGASTWDYPDNVMFDAGTMLEAGDVFVVCHGSADDIIQAECDQSFTYLSNGDDVFGLTQIGSGILLDLIGEFGEDPGSGWEVAGVANGTKDHTLVRKFIVEGNWGDWGGSAGTNADDSEWVVFEQNTWDYVGSHPHEFAIIGCMDSNAVNYNADATVQAQDQYGNIACTYASCDDVPSEGCMYADAFAGWNEFFGPDDCVNYGGMVCEEQNDGPPECIADCPNFQILFDFFELNQGDLTEENVCDIFASWNGDTCLDDCSDEVCDDCDNSDLGEITEIIGVCSECLAAGSCEGLFGDECDECHDDCNDNGDTDECHNDCDQSEACDDGDEGIVFSGAFGGAFLDGDNTYVNPTGSEGWAGFANEDGSIYPFSFTDGGEITFTGATAGTDVDVYFRFEFNPYPDIEPSFNTETVTVSGTDEAFYSVGIPALGENTYSSFLLYVTTLDAPVTITDVAVTSSEYVDPCADVTCGDGQECIDGGCVDVAQPSVVTFDLDGLDHCGFVSVTGTWDGWSGWGANTDTGMAASIPPGGHEFVILCVDTVDGWWNDIWANSTAYYAPIDGSCWNGNSEYPNYTLNVDGSGNPMTISYCAGTCDAICVDECAAGDVNDDDVLDVLDIVIMVNSILENMPYDDCADYNGDGTINVLDVVAVVNAILSGRVSDATEAELIQDEDQLMLIADGFIGAVQLELHHDSDFEIELTKDAMVAEYRTVNNITEIIIVVPESEILFDSSGEYEIVDMIVTDSSSELETVVLNHPGRPSCKRCKSFKLSSAYPNPFNPSTTINLSVQDEGLVEVSVFNMAGKEVAQLSSEFVEAGEYSMTWVADEFPSGVYLIRASMMNTTSVQKVILLK